MNPRETLNEAPSKLQDLDTRIWEMRQNRERLQAKLRLREAALLADITAAKTDEGKPRFSNESARSAQLQQSLQADTEHRSLQVTLHDLDLGIAQAQIARDYWDALQKNARVLLLADAPQLVKAVM